MTNSDGRRYPYNLPRHSVSAGGTVIGERYIATHVIPDLHSVDPSTGPPPIIQKVATIET